MSFDVLVKLVPILLFFSTYLLADDVMVITADRIKSNTDKSSSDVRIITADEIKSSTTNSLPELLAKESDLSVVTSGPNGSNASIFIRGTDSSHTLVVIDGIIMNDPSNPNRQFDIGKLSLNNIERIEILKGSQGLAYGSNAIGGVIVIKTKKAKRTELAGEYYADVGTFNTVNAGANLQKKINNLSLSFGGDHMESDGFSVADKRLNPQAEKDATLRDTLNLNASLSLPANYIADLNLRYMHDSADLDKGGGAGSDDPNDKQHEEELYSKLQLTKYWDAGNAETKFSYARSKHYRNLEVLPDSVHPQQSNTTTMGEMNSLTIAHTYFVNEQLTQNINIDWQHEKDQTKHFNQNLSGFLYHQYELPKSIFNFGLRLDHNKIFNDHATYKLAAGYKIGSDDLLKLSYSTGFRAPSINQLFDPTYGNLSLIPESSQSSELSFEKNFTPVLKSVTALFYTKIKNRLSYDPNTFVNRNSGTAEILGLEQSAKNDWSRVFNQSLSFTILKTRELNKGEKLARRPDFNIKNSLSYQLKDSHHLDFEQTYRGQTLDVDNSGNNVKTPAYFIMDLNYRYVLNERNDYYIKIKNILDTNYEEIYGYGTGGRAITVGAHSTF